MGDAATRCYFPSCDRAGTERVFIGDDAGGRDVLVCATCRKERFEE